MLISARIPSWFAFVGILIASPAYPANVPAASQQTEFRQPIVGSGTVARQAMHTVERQPAQTVAQQPSASKKVSEATRTAVTKLNLVEVFVPSRDKYPHIRIPAIVTTKQGTLLAFAEGRQGGDHSENDIILKRSTDGGKTWGELQLVQSAGRLALNNPQSVVLDSGRVLIMYQRNKHGEREVKPGFAGEDVGYTLIQHSDDDGRTWSKPRDITRGVKRGVPVSSHASGPGIGIVLRQGRHKGRVVMPFNQGPFGKWKVYASYSDDGGDTWKYGETAPDGGKGLGNEVQMVELADGRLMLTARVQGGANVRKIAYSLDAGQTWSPLKDDAQLPDPHCQAAILRYSWPQDGKSRIVFANPASTKDRTNGTLRISYDEGQTWPISKTVYRGAFAYCCLTKLDDGAIGLLFEADDYRRIVFVRIPLRWLTDATAT